MAHIGYNQHAVSTEELLALLAVDGEIFDLWLTMDDPPMIMVTIKTGS